MKKRPISSKIVPNLVFTKFMILGLFLKLKLAHTAQKAQDLLIVTNFARYIGLKFLNILRTKLVAGTLW